MIIDKLKGYGFKINFQDLLFETGGAAPGRLHLARLLLKKKYVHSIDQAFSLYLRHDRPAYVPREGLTTFEAIDLLLAVGAIPVIAHPGINDVKMIEELIEKGLKGVEVFHPDHNRNLVRYYNDYAAAKGLLVTGGSDFHGQSINNHGYQPQYAVDYEYLQKMKDLIERRQVD